MRTIENLQRQRKGVSYDESKNFMEPDNRGEVENTETNADSDGGAETQLADCS